MKEDAKLEASKWMAEVCQKSSRASWALEQLRDNYEGAVRVAASRGCPNRGNDFYSDVSQEVWMNVWQKACAFDPSRGTFGGWIKTVARNIAINACRELARLSVVRGRAPDELPEKPDGADDSFDGTLREAMIDCVKHYLSQGTPEEKRNVTIFVMTCTGVKSAGEMASEYNVTRNQIYKWTLAGKELIKACVQRKMS
jgi:RNA polymerase sigma factor (sigma-70 family)